ncbi:MAG TPA: histidinol-phosphate transaminase [Gammaproteobacteria bacterium]|nr:histidinol-phosphate transaminase [Gammaproteobacteria bacterium]
MTDPLVSRWIRPEIQALSAYHVPSSQGLIKLDAMENPYTWPPELVESWLKSLRTTAVNRYPDPAGVELVARIREVMQVPDGQAILLGNGSDELIQVLAMSVAGPGRCILAPEPGFVMYQMIARFTGMEYVGVPLRATDFSLDRDAMLAAIEEHEPALVFLAYPNNPTGNQWDRADMEWIIESTPGLVVVDEAYSPFASDSFLQDLGRYPNLLVMRTFSKLGLAGLRLGYLCGPERLLGEFDKIRLPYNINTLTQVTADFALSHIEVFHDQAERIKASRAVLLKELSQLSGLSVFPSSANFILVRTPEGQAGRIHQGLLENGILIKNLSGAGGLLQDCLRITVGTDEENSRFLEVFTSLL